MIEKSKQNYKWFLVGLVSVVLAAPNATIAKIGTNSINPVLFNAIRFSFIMFLTLPLLISSRQKITKRNLKYSLIGGIAMTVAVFAFIGAINLSQASYVSIITLVTPIIFIIFSNKVTGEKINRRSMLGILLAVIGAIIVVLVPIAIRQSGTFVFYPAASALAIVNTLSFPVGIIYYKKANDDGLPISALLSISACVTVFSHLVVIATIIGIVGFSFISVSTNALIAAAYSGVVVALIARVMNVKSYEHIGAVRTSALFYLETFLAILIPVLVLREKLSLEMVIGGIVILIGVYVVEHHKSVNHKHHHIFHSHQ